MSLQANIIINGYSMLLLLAIYIHSKKNKDKKADLNTIFLKMIQVLFLLLIFDTMSRCDGYVYTAFPFFNRIGNFMLFIMNPILPLLWFYYVYVYIWKDEVRIRRIKIIAHSIVAVNVSLVILSQFTGWYYYIDANNVYHRGPLFAIPSVLVLGTLVVTIFYIMYHRYKIERKHYFTLLFFIFPPLIGVFLQIYIYGISFLLNSVTLSLLMLLLNIQNQSVYLDHLTGAYNRKRLEVVLKEKIRKATIRHSFSLVMIDINDFKEINDTYGHQSGDEALIRVSRTIEKAIEPHDVLVRYGGDEFCIVLKTDQLYHIKRCINQIESSIEAQNQKQSYPYKISFSIGYGIYDVAAHMSGNAFIDFVDQCMYKEKARIKKLQTK